MGSDGRRRAAVASALAFLVTLSVLTVLRVWNVEPSTATQSRIVWAGALVVAAAVAAYSYRTVDPVGGLILAFGPSLGFTTNLFVPVAAGPAAAFFPPLAAAVVATAVGGVGFLAGCGARICLTAASEASL